MPKYLVIAQFVALFVASSFFLNACQSMQGHQNPLEIHTEENNEGFYPLFPKEAMPVDLPEKYGFSRELLDRLATYSGQLFYKYTVKVNRRNYEKQVQSYCSNEGARSMNPKLCAYLETKRKICMTKGCNFMGALPACSGVRYQNFFITAKHCLPKNTFPRNPSAKFIRSDGTIHMVKLKKTSLLRHNKPYDVAIFRLLEAKFTTDKNFPIRMSKLEFREPVAGIGWPILHIRQGRQRKFNYDLEYKHHRVTFGRVMQPNEMGRSFCHVTNKDGVSNIENWELENTCKRGRHWRKERGFKKRYYARKEHDPFLTNSDMTWGMSGSPLFDQQGRLVGIGSNVLSNDPREYHRDKFAIYVRADRIYKMLGSIEPRLN